MWGKEGTGLSSGTQEDGKVGCQVHVDKVPERLEESHARYLLLLPLLLLAGRVALPSRILTGSRQA